MDEDLARKLVFDSINQARAEKGLPPLNSQNDNNQMFMFLLAVVVAVASYFLLNHFKPGFVTVDSKGKKQFDQARGVVASLVAGLLVLLVYYLCMNN
jgi:hypothetical protein